MREEDVQKVMESENAIILDAFMKAKSVLSEHKVASVSVSGGADSDIMLDMFERIGDTGCKIIYVFFDTGLEYQATLRHLSYLEQHYEVCIQRIKAKRSIPYCVRNYGQPLVSKYVSAHIERLQKRGFRFEDEPLDVLVERYPNCIDALKWWTNSHNHGRSTYDIRRNYMLKEFLIENPPDFPVSSKCCMCAKKNTAHEFYLEIGADLTCTAVRKAEGGARNKSPSLTCFTKKADGIDVYRPLFWFRKADCEEYRRLFGLRRSDCYEVWGLKRTGCTGCPFNKNIINEIAVIEQYEPKMARAARSIFAESYEWTERFVEYRRQMEYKEKSPVIDVWKRMFDAIGDDPEWSSS